MIKLKNINKTYQNRKVLKDININFREKELVAILGESGCGKSTLLNIISGAEYPDSGSLYLGEKDLLKQGKKKLDYYRNNYISYIYQDYNLIKYLNVKENINVACQIKNQNQKDINTILTDLKINHLIKSDVSKISGGEQQRVAIARSLITKNKIILADEPTGALDSKTGLEIMDIFKKLSKSHLIITVTHNEDLAKKYATRIIRLKDGEILEDTNPYNKEDNKDYKIKKKRLSYISAFNITIKNLKKKKVRTYLTTLALSIGLISLSLVLSISSGFEKEIKKLEEEILFNYPIIISKEAVNLESIFNEDKNVYKEDFININKSGEIITNTIDDKLLKKLENLDKGDIEGISHYKSFYSKIYEYLIVNPNNNFFDIIKGNYPKETNEIMLLLDNNNSINETLANYIKIKDSKLEEVIDKQITINNKRLTIKGVVKSNNNYYKDTYGIIYNDEIFDEDVNHIQIFPTTYESKQKVKEELKEYNITDDSESVIKIIKEFVTAVSYMLIAFSVISLIASILMMAIVSYISVLERKKEIGILKTLGASPKDIKKIFLSENYIIGLLSSLFTVYFVYELSGAVNELVSDKIGIDNLVNQNIKIIILVFIISLLISYLSGLIPAKIASKKKIVDILKDN